MSALATGFAAFREWDRSLTRKASMTLLGAARGVASRLGFVISGRGAGWLWSMPRGTRFDYAAAVGDGSGNSAVMAVLLWLLRVFPEAPIGVRTIDVDGTRQPIPAHPMARLIKRPNPYYSGRLLLMATLGDLTVRGNAYWYKVRNAAGRVVELWYVPFWLMTPRWPQDGSAYISHYDYAPNGVPIPVDPRDVVHFRFGLDSSNQRLGLSPLYALLREIYSDDEAGNFAAALLRNLGIPGVIITPAFETVQLDEADAQTVKTEFAAKFGGDNRGEPLVLSSPAKVEVLSFSPQQMNLRELRLLPEERISAVFGVPAIVAGLGAGLNRSTFANYKEAREAAYESNILPMQALMAADLDVQLLPEFGGSEGEETWFDTSEVRALQEDEGAKWTRAGAAVGQGWLTVADALRYTGQAATDEDDYFLRPAMTLEVPRHAIENPSDENPAAAVDDPIAALAAQGTTPSKALARLVALRELKLAPASVEAVKAATHESELAAAERAIRAKLKTYMRDLTTSVEKAWNGSKAGASLNGHGGAGVAVKAAGDDLVSDDDDTALRKLMHALYVSIGEKAAKRIGRELGVEDLLDQASKRLTARADTLAEKVVDINETTRKALKDVIRRGFEAGYTTDQIARGVSADEYEGIHGVMKEARDTRTVQIARTEAGHALNTMSGESYKAAGVTHVTVRDGDYDEVCAEVDGQTWTVERSLEEPLGHPNCTRRFSPVVE